MAYVKKRKVKIKKKNFIIFILCIVLFVFLIFKGITFTYKIITSPKKEPKVRETIKIKKEKKKTTKKEKLEKLNNINKKLDYFDDSKIDRYIMYKDSNPDMELTQVIKNVNMNLDLTPYKVVEPAKYINTEKVLVNKYYYLDKTYEQKNLRNIDNKYALNGMRLVDYAANAFEEMCSAASKEGLTIVSMSAYRSYDYQVNLYNRYVRMDGEEKADSYSGRPGHSEHQTGLATDVYNKKENYTNFERTKEFDWMQEHAHEYGFILRFPKDKENETGYVYESWHYRYVGVDAAKYIKKNNISFEEYYATVIDKK